MKIVKFKDKLGILQIEQKKVKSLIDIKTGEEVTIWSLNNVLLEDGSLVAITDSEMEVIEDDWSAECDSEN